MGDTLTFSFGGEVRRLAARKQPSPCQQESAFISQSSSLKQIGLLPVRVVAAAAVGTSSLLFLCNVKKNRANSFDVVDKSR